DRCCDARDSWLVLLCGRDRLRRGFGLRCGQQLDLLNALGRGWDHAEPLGRLLTDPRRSTQVRALGLESTLAIEQALLILAQLGDLVGDVEYLDARVDAR